ncbi:MAG TPA: hypothetical protein DHV77_03505, partial [Erysipelotrichaceae bacterium]|nr:hypothetical protein [Erysipelotrichaceae bacterium]
KFMAERMQGIVRYSREIVAELDKLIDDCVTVTLVIPPNAKDIPVYRNIKIESIGKHTGVIWEQLDLGRYVRKHKEAKLINLCNVAPFGVKPGVTVVHDIMYKVNHDHYLTLRNRVSRIWHELQYSYLFKHEELILTVSNFSKKEIEKYYPVTKGKVRVVPDGWEHVLKYKESKDWQDRYPYLQPGKFYFSLATLSKNKNGIWIMKVAEKNPDAVFAMGGKIYETEYEKIPPNVYLLGFISDEDACALMKNCKAFLFPSIYEGFGIPPLEALALGAEVIAAHSTSLPEVLGDSVHYIDPYDYDVNLEQIIHKDVAKKEDVLRKYGWNTSAQILLQLLMDI